MAKTKINMTYYNNGYGTENIIGSGKNGISKGYSDAALHLLIMLICALPLVLSFILSTNGKNTELRLSGLSIQVGFPCFFKSLTGFRCPACGMSRAFIYMSNLNFGAAWAMNRAGLMLYIFCLLQLPYRLLRIAVPAAPAYKALVWMQAIFLAAIGLVAVVDFALQFI